MEIASYNYFLIEDASRYKSNRLWGFIFKGIIYGEESYRGEVLYGGESYTESSYMLKRRETLYPEKSYTWKKP